MLGTGDQSCWLAKTCKILLLLLCDSYDNDGIGTIPARGG